MTASSPVLVADIGGTNSRFALAWDGTIDAPVSIANDSVPDIAAAIAIYLAGRDERPSRAVLALAAPVEGRAVTLTNRAWRIDADVLERRFGLERVDLLNDFAAVAHALPDLTEGQLHPLGDAAFSPAATKIVLGPGTGLGVAALIHDRSSWHAVASEGGHIEFAATTPAEAEVFDRIRARMGRVSAEFVISGTGLALLDLVMAELHGDRYAPRTGEDIASAAALGDARARDVMTLFCDALARFAGDMAITFVARGGVYLAGGIPPKIAGLIDAGRFRAAFESKAPHQALMASIATAIVLEPNPGLVGCAAYASRLK